MLRLMNHKEVEQIQVAMLKNKLSDRECARKCGKNIKDYRDIVFRRKQEDDSRIQSIVKAITNE